MSILRTKRVASNLRRNCALAKGSPSKFLSDQKSSEASILEPYFVAASMALQDEYQQHLTIVKCMVTLLVTSVNHHLSLCPRSPWPLKQVVALTSSPALPKATPPHRTQIVGSARIKFCCHLGSGKSSFSFKHFLSLEIESPVPFSKNTPPKKINTGAEKNMLKFKRNSSTKPSRWLQAIDFWAHLWALPANAWRNTWAASQEMDGHGHKSRERRSMPYINQPVDVTIYRQFIA